MAKFHVKRPFYIRAFAVLCSLILAILSFFAFSSPLTVARADDEEELVDTNEYLRFENIPINYVIMPFFDSSFSQSVVMFYPNSFLSFTLHRHLTAAHDWGYICIEDLSIGFSLLYEKSDYSFGTCSSNFTIKKGDTVSTNGDTNWYVYAPSGSYYVDDLYDGNVDAVFKAKTYTDTTSPRSYDQKNLHDPTNAYNNYSLSQSGSFLGSKLHLVSVGDSQSSWTPIYSAINNAVGRAFMAVGFFHSGNSIPFENIVTVTYSYEPNSYNDLKMSFLTDPYSYGIPGVYTITFISSWGDSFGLSLPAWYGYLSFSHSVPFSDFVADTADLNYAIGYNAGYEQGKISGQQTWYDNGYDAGNYDGYETGYEEGYNDGDAVGFNRGYNKGRDVGYDAGLLENNNSFYNLFSAVVDAPVSVFIDLFDVDILGVNISKFALSLLSLCMLVAIIRIFL